MEYWRNGFPLGSIQYSITPILLLLAAPQVIEKTAFLHLVEIAPVDQLRRLDFLRAWISDSELVEDGLQRVRAHVESRLHRFDFVIVRGLENLSVVEPQVFCQDLK